MKKLMKMMEEKEGAVDPRMLDAKKEVLRELLDMAKERAGKDITGGLQKVTVAAPDKTSLEKGLAKAQDLVGDLPSLEDLGVKKERMELPEVEEMPKRRPASEEMPDSEMEDDEEDDEEDEE